MGVSRDRDGPIWGFPKIRGTNNKGYSILGSILGSPYFGKLPFLKGTRSAILRNSYVGASCRTSKCIKMCVTSIALNLGS